MSSITGEFQFEIGDIVYFRTASHCDGRKPSKFMVYERILQQCHGGIQKLYKVGGDSINGNMYPEVLLTAEEPKYELRPEENLKDVRRVAEASSLWRPTKSKESDSQ